VFLTDRRAGIVIFFALALPVLAGAIGLGFEVAMWYKERRDIQTAADAAAVGGAYEAMEWTSTSASINTRASADAARNGFDIASNPPSVNNPPSSGGYTSDTDAVEVTLSEPFTLMFAGIVSSAASFTIRARAVATTGTTGEACVLSLASAGTGVSVTGSGAATFDGCQVAANSSDPSAMDVAGAADLTVDCYSVVGGVTVTPGLVTDADCEGQTGGFAIEDPYDDLTTPAYGSCDEPGGYTLNSGATETLAHAADFDTPYVICGDLSVGNGTLILDPGLYIVEGDFTANANANIQGNGVTIIMKNGGQLGPINGSAEVDLRAPSTAAAGDWQGLLFYQDRNDASVCTGNCNVINGDSSSIFEGAMYFPNQELVVSGGNESGSPCMQIVAYAVTFTGSSVVAADNTSCMTAGVDPIEVPGPVHLVE